MNIYYYKKINIDIPRFWKEIIKISIPVGISLVVGILINLFITSSGFIYMIIKGLLFTLIYAALVMKIGMNDYEKNLIMNPLKKVINNLLKKSTVVRG